MIRNAIEAPLSFINLVTIRMMFSIKKDEGGVYVIRILHGAMERTRHL